MFGVLYFVAPLLEPLPGSAVWAVRTVLSIPVVLGVLVATRQLGAFTAIAARIRARPVFLLAVLACGALFGVQLWLFAWAPMNGRGLQTALGYFLLPLVMVLVGRFLYHDRLQWWHWVAVALATVGVSLQIYQVGSLSWETLLVAFGYPAYFVLRRAFGLGDTGGLLWDFIVVSPLAVFALARELASGSAIAQNPALVWLAPLFGVLSGIALWLYVLASRLLSATMFGLLSYVEPALLVVASYLLGERISPYDFITYGAIWLAILVLLVGGVGSVRSERRWRRRN